MLLVGCWLTWSDIPPHDIHTTLTMLLNPLNGELNPICHLLALLGAHHILHVSRLRVNLSYQRHDLQSSLKCWCLSNTYIKLTAVRISYYNFRKCISKYYLQQISQRILLVHITRTLHPTSFGSFLYPSSGSADIQIIYMDLSFIDRRYCKCDSIHVWYLKYIYLNILCDSLYV